MIRSFGTTPGDPTEPYTALTLGSDGALYGTSSGGGVNSGTVFKITAEGTVAVLHAFGTMPDDGLLVAGGPLIQAADALFYGTTRAGGSAGGGTVFKISALGVYTRMYSFGQFDSDGEDPLGGLVQGPGGDLYGTTIGGGLDVDGGTIYKISLSGEYTQLYTFGSGPTDGKWPFAGLTLGNNGGLYGTTFFSRPFDYSTPRAGTVFRFTLGAGVTTLYDFHAGSCVNDGAAPENTLIRDADGNFYGTTREGGKYDRGTVFRITPTGEESVLYSFGSVPGDGKEPSGRLLQLADGTLLGVTRFGGAYENPEYYTGTAFMLAPDGTYTLLHSFGGTATGGAMPWGGLTLGADGAIYGTTVAGGATTDRPQGLYGYGTVFKLVIDNEGTAPTFRYVPHSCEAVVPVTNVGPASGGGVLSLSLLLGLGLGALARGTRFH